MSSEVHTKAGSENELVIAAVNCYPKSSATPSYSAIRQLCSLATIREGNGRFQARMGFPLCQLSRSVFPRIVRDNRGV